MSGQGGQKAGNESSRRKLSRGDSTEALAWWRPRVAAVSKLQEKLQISNQDLRECLAVEKISVGDEQFRRCISGRYKPPQATKWLVLFSKLFNERDGKPTSPEKERSYFEAINAEGENADRGQRKRRRSRVAHQTRKLPQAKLGLQWVGIVITLHTQYRFDQPTKRNAEPKSRRWDPKDTSEWTVRDDVLDAAYGFGVGKREYAHFESDAHTMQFEFYARIGQGLTQHLNTLESDVLRVKFVRLVEFI
jgi:hypothetical protein